MGNKEFLKTKGFYVITFLLALFILHPLNLFGQVETPGTTFKVEVTDNLASVNVQDADLSEVLKEIGKKTGVKITIGQILIGKKITAQFENLDIEGALKEILKNNYYILSFVHDPLNPEKKILKEVKAEGDIIGSKPLKGRLMTLDIPYGKGKREVGAFSGPEGSSVGPMSFTVDDAGNIYICDSVNERVQIFSYDGKYLSTIPLKKETIAADIVIDKDGFVYIYDRSAEKLYKYEKNGNLISSINVDERQFHGVGPMHIINNEIYVDTCNNSNECGYFIIGRTLFNNVLVGPSVEEQEKPKPKEKDIGLSGRKYKGKKFIEGYNTEMEIEDKDGINSKILSLPSARILTSVLLGEDERGNFYFQTRTVENTDRLYNIDKFNPDGAYIGTAQIPGGDYAFFTTKDFRLSENGNIYNFIPEKDKLRIHIFLSQGN